MILKVSHGPATSASPENSLETGPGPHPRFKDQKLWGWIPAICPPGNSETHSSWRTTNLEDEIVPSLRIVRGVLQILRVYQNRRFKTFMSKVEVHVWPLQGAALVETGLQRQGVSLLPPTHELEQVLLTLGFSFGKWKAHPIYPTGL